MKRKSIPTGNCGTDTLPTSMNGVPNEQSLGKLLPNSGNAKRGDTHANPELNSEQSDKCVETIEQPSLTDEEIVHSCGKPQGESASPARTPAALTKWRCKNIPNSGNPTTLTHDTPSIGEVRKASELGYNIHKGHESNYIYSMCTRCSRTRWVRVQDINSGKGLICRSCCHTKTKAFRNHINRVVESGAKRASELGKPVFKKRDPWYYKHLCPVCGKEVWHQRKDMKRACSPQCAQKLESCHPRGEDHPNWNGGRYLHSNGYMVVQLPVGHPYYAMAHARGDILEHRLIMAQHIGRPLVESEVVHHINGNKQDNRIENLELLPNLASHLPYILLQQQVYALQKQVNQLEAEALLLKRHIVELEYGNPEIADSEADRAIVETLQDALTERTDEEEHGE